MTYDLEKISGNFRIEGDFVQACPYGSGHINDTFKIVCKKGVKSFCYVLQRIDHEIFKDPYAVMDNITRITEHIHCKLKAHNSTLADRQLRVISTNDGASCHRDGNGNYWRIYNFIENAFTCDVIETDDQAFEAAKMFGWFQKMLVDLPGAQLHETIPDFHNTPKRFKAFQQMLKVDPCNRAGSVKAEIEFAFEHAGICNILLDMVKKYQIPIRITHNDTKINNIMLDEKTGSGVCVIDLDTVMPGLSLYDFGDMVRTAASSAQEDETDLLKVEVLMPRFEKLVEGFISQTGVFLTDIEKKHLVSGGKVIIFEQFIRFLSDYIAGDKYYKIHRENHNLDRSRTQMKLLQSIIAQQEQMNEVVEKVLSENNL